MTFQQFIDGVGVRKLAMMCNVTETAVYKWRNLDGTPRPETAFFIILQSNNILDWEKIYFPYVQKRLQGKKIKTQLGGKHDTNIEFNFDK